ncbi:MAG: FAD:protein FMN transferase [Pirellulales bacterium]|nr:FAD:protein FMN transferase [Pirellulales bacterium]
MAKRKHSRRDFLKGRPAVDAMADRLDHAPTDPTYKTNEPALSEGCFLRVSREAMAGQFEVLFNVGQYPHAAEAAMAALDEAERIEEQISFYRASSELTRVNQLAAAGPVKVEAALFDLLELAVQLHGETGGTLDITAGPLSDAWGFSRRQGEIPDQQRLEQAMACVGCDKLELDAKSRTVRFRTPGMQINLGAIGKGHALDRCADLLTSQGIDDFMIHAGQSSVIARGSIRPVGTTPAEAKPTGWLVGVHDPLHHGRRLAEVRLDDRALGTSGSEKQFFRYQGRRLSHVLDPRTGWPAEGLLSATVLAPTATVADGLSTAMFVMGPGKAIAFCETHSELATVLVQSKANRVEVLSCGFEPGELKVLA